MLNKKFLALIAFIFIALPLTSFHPNERGFAKSVIEKMFSSIDNINTLKFTMKKVERVDGKLSAGVQEVKFNREPKKIYTKIIAPNKGTEVLYIHGQNKNQAYVKPKSFPYITLSLNPYGSAMRNNNHHTIHEVGFDYIGSIIKYIARKSEDEFDGIFIYQGDTVYDNKKCYKILINYTPFSYINYTVKKGETVTDIAYKLYVSDYVILKINSDIDDYEDVKEGQVIKVPNAYARKTYLCIDQKTYLPIVQIMHDEKGLLAKYEFQNLILNPSISSEEFSKEYKAYGF